MKFEKFLKSCGTHGQIVKTNSGDKWLVCGGVGMIVPKGVINLLGTGEASEATREIVQGIVYADTDDKVTLTEAYLPADGRPSDIVRVFGNPKDDIYIGIHNADYGLLEKSDQNLAFLEIEDDDLNTSKYLLVLDQRDEVVGFIAGVEE